MDSNHDKVIQSHLCYRYTTRQKGGKFGYHIVGKSQMTSGPPAFAFGVLFSFSVPSSAMISRKLPKVFDLKFASGSFADPSIEGRVAVRVIGTVGDGPIKWLKHGKQIWIFQPGHFSLSSGFPISNRPLSTVTF
jgi:hypothetical protein